MSVIPSISAFGRQWSTSAVAPSNIIGSHQSTNPWGPIGVPYIHDFTLGPFNLAFTLDPATLNWQTPIDGRRPFHTNIPPSSGTGSSYMSTLLDTGGVGNPSDFIVNFTNLYTADNLKFTRTQKLITGDPNAGNIMGPYNLSYTTSGTKNFNLVLYWGDIWYSSTGHNNYDTGGFNPTSAPYTGNTGTYTSNAYNQGGYFDNSRFQLQLYQKGVPVITVGGPSGAALPNASTISGMDPIINSTITLNNSNSRVHQPSGTISWYITKLTSSGLVPAVLNTDFQLGPTETFSSATINLKWLLSGSYTLYLTTSNATIPVVSEQLQTTIVNFSVGQTTINTINLPQIQPVITPIVAYDNTVVTTTPTLTGIEVFKIQVDADVDITNAVWTQQIDTNPVTTITLNQAGWAAEVLNRCDVACEVRGIISNNVLAIAAGYGPHTFNLGVVAGGVKVGFEVAAKSTLIIPFLDASSVGPPATSTE